MGRRARGKYVCTNQTLLKTVSIQTRGSIGIPVRNSLKWGQYNETQILPRRDDPKSLIKIIRLSHFLF